MIMVNLGVVSIYFLVFFASLGACYLASRLTIKRRTKRGGIIMDKFKFVAGTIISVALVETILSFVIPNVLLSFVYSANATIAATSNMSNYPGTSEFLIASPWILYFIPPVIGIVVIVAYLRFQNQG